MAHDDVVPPPARRRLSRRGAWLAGLVAVVAGLLLAARLGPLTPAGRSAIESLATGLEVGRVGRLRVAGLSGDVWRGFSVREVALMDSRGVWLRATDLRVSWRPAELIARRVHVARATAARLEVLRRPLLGPAHPPQPPPVAVILDTASTVVVLDAPFSQSAGVYRAEVSGLDIERRTAARGILRAVSATRPGDYLSVTGDIARSKRFVLFARAREAAGGPLAGALGLAPGLALRLDLDAQGDPKDGRFDLTALIGGRPAAVAHGNWRGGTGAAHGRIDLDASSLLAPARRMLGAEARFDLAATGRGGDLADVRLLASSDNLILAARGGASVARAAAGPHGLAVAVQVRDPGRIVGGLVSGPFSFRGGLGGDVRHWVASGAVSLQHPKADGFSLASVGGPLRVEGGVRGLSVAGAAQGDGGAGRGLVAALLGARPSARFDLVQTPGGRTLVRALHLTGAGLAIDASGERALMGGLGFEGQARLANLAAAAPGARGLVTATWR
ncbi:MAG: hypothetical protein JOZ27_02520, partial [Caulobacteraceae bacterium]|nr:hypothetical protein [Caulobacteraceae bacterium]